MKKTIHFYVWRIFLASLAVFMLAGCSVAGRTKPTTPQLSTSALLYNHYTPSEISNIHLEFDYPSSWIFSEERIQDTDTILIGLGDPRVLTVPTLAPDESHRMPSDFGRIRITIESIMPGQTLDALIEPHKQGYSNVSWIIPIKNYRLKIDGIDMIAFEYQAEPFDGNGFASLMFERDMFFAFKDQLYQITFLIAEKERGGEFEQGYEYFFNSLKLAP